MNIARTEMVEKELDGMIERRSRKGEVDPDELEPFYMESVRRYNDRRREEMRAAWCEYHQGQGRPRNPHSQPRERGRKLMDVQPEGAAEPGAQKPHERGWRQARGRGGR